MGQALYRLNRRREVQPSHCDNEPVPFPTSLHRAGRRFLALALSLPLSWVAFAHAQDDASPSSPPASSASESESRKYETITRRGRVVWMAEALERRFDVQSVPEAEDRLQALETTEGELLPIVEDIRGRSFRRDERLRDREVELLMRRYEGSPMVQVITIYALKADGKYELDYWCDICAIAIYELKPCDCCQGETRLRERRVPEPAPTEENASR
ncbi:MAG: hypothetical protein WDZ59_15330 [Pirellulales bacterium]